MKYLICGLGSIGKRHLENLLKLGVNSSEIGVLRRRQATNALGDKFLEKYPSIAVFHNLAKALREKPEAVFVTNPTALHIKAALKAAESGCHLFLENIIPKLPQTETWFDSLCLIKKSHRRFEKILFRSSIGKSPTCHPVLDTGSSF